MGKWALIYAAILWVGIAMAGDRTLYFPKNYLESRTRFLEMTGNEKLPGSERGEFSVPSATDSDLKVHWVHAPAVKKPETLLVLLSGTHGPESFTATAMIRLFFTEIFPEIARDRVGVLAVHALNPYGFKTHRRVTENNVDLNRNFGLTAELYSTPNAKYGEFEDLIAPKEQVSGIVIPFLKTVMRIGWELVSGKSSRASITAAIESGQYQYPKALQYGGAAPEPQTRFLIELLRKIAASYEEIVFVDFHTGLGDMGELHVLTGNEFKSNHNDLVERFLTKHPDPKAFVLTSGESKGFYPVSGDTIDVPPLLFPDKKVLAVTAEFGTLGKSLPKQLDSLHRLIQENQGFHFGYASPELKQEVEARFLELFFPESNIEWKNSVLDKGFRFLKGIAAQTKSATP